jgi:hypothetical protein
MWTNVVPLIHQQADEPWFLAADVVCYCARQRQVCGRIRITENGLNRNTNKKTH